jgi:hypothetical protein
MKKPYQYIAFIFILSCFHTSNAPAQNQFAKTIALLINIQPIFYQLTPQDKRNYTLSAGQPIKIKRDTFVYKFTQNDFHVYREKQDQMTIPVKFINNSNDTLEYIGMQCSWWDIYLTNNPKVEIQPAYEMCYKNGPTVIKIAPKNSTVVNIAVGCAKGLSRDTKFRIGMIVQKYNGGLFNIPMSRESNTIWSNEIDIL